MTGVIRNNGVSRIWFSVNVEGKAVDFFLYHLSFPDFSVLISS